MPELKFLVASLNKNLFYHINESRRQWNRFKNFKKIFHIFATQQMKITRNKRDEMNVLLFFKSPPQKCSAFNFLLIFCAYTLLPITAHSKLRTQISYSRIKRTKIRSLILIACVPRSIGSSIIFHPRFSGESVLPCFGFDASHRDVLRFLFFSLICYRQSEERERKKPLCRRNVRAQV